MFDKGEPDISKKQICEEWHNKRIQTRDQDAQELGIPLIISEFGACYGTEACV